MREFTLRLTAHLFSRSPDGALQTTMTHAAKTTAVCASLEGAHRTATEFGTMNAPCVVWCGIANGRSPRGFEGWAEAMAQQTFGEGDA